MWIFQNSQYLGIFQKCILFEWETSLKKLPVLKNYDSEVSSNTSTCILGIFNCILIMFFMAQQVTLVNSVCWEGEIITEQSRKLGNSTGAELKIFSGSNIRCHCNQGKAEHAKELGSGPGTWREKDTHLNWVKYLEKHLWRQDLHIHMVIARKEHPNRCNSIHSPKTDEKYLLITLHILLFLPLIDDKTGRASQEFSNKIILKDYKLDFHRPAHLKSLILKIA